MSNISVNTITDASGGSTASINGLTPQASNMQPFNRIINGAMTISQRNAGASVTISTDTTYTLDRWMARTDNVAASKYSVQLNAGSVTPPEGFNNYLGVTSLSSYSSSSTNYYWLAQFIEGYNVVDLKWGTASAGTVTLSFWVYSSLTGTFSGSLVNGGYNRSYVFTYSVPTANTWTKVDVTITGDTTGTWLTTNGLGLQVRFNLGSGSNNQTTTVGSWQAGNYPAATGSVSVVGTSGATFYITGVQLEAGSSASSFAHENVGDTLQKCQRYYQTFGGGFSGWPSTPGATTLQISFVIPVPMRATPTLSATGTLGVSTVGSSSSQSSFTYTNQSGANNLIMGYLSNFSAMSSVAYFSNGGTINVSAEL